IPPLPLATILSTALPPLPREARAVVDLLACTNGLLPSGSKVVTFLGLRTPPQVARLLRRSGLPPLEELAGWTRVLHWLNESARIASRTCHLLSPRAPPHRPAVVARTARWRGGSRYPISHDLQRFAEPCFRIELALRSTATSDPVPRCHAKTASGSAAIQNVAGVRAPTSAGLPGGPLSDAWLSIRYCDRAGRDRVAHSRARSRIGAPDARTVCLPGVHPGRYRSDACRARAVGGAGLGHEPIHQGRCRRRPRATIPRRRHIDGGRPARSRSFARWTNAVRDDESRPAVRHRCRG